MRLALFLIHASSMIFLIATLKKMHKQTNEETDANYTHNNTEA
jgi:hypothetical protein